MPNWKKILLRSAGFGIGFALTMCMVGGVIIFYRERPRPPKPWNKNAIIAEYDNVGAGGDERNLVFYYTLQNNTEVDYRIDSDTGIELSGNLLRQREFSEFSSGKKHITVNYPVFVPAKGRVLFSLTLTPYPYPIAEKSDPTPAERDQYEAEVAKFVTKKLANLNGFVLFDTTNRYQINFPSGWENGSKEVQAPDKR